jgi:hypothetical protein
MLSYRFSRSHAAVRLRQKIFLSHRVVLVLQSFFLPLVFPTHRRARTDGGQSEEEKKATKNPPEQHGGHIINCKSFNGGTQQINLITEKNGNLKANWGINVKTRCFN